MPLSLADRGARVARGLWQFNPLCVPKA